uniref:Bm13043 n=1 Tax=Brugia malayi TaxID=6279 RepID=A0A7I4K7H2_BRUMA
MKYNSLAINRIKERNENYQMEEE